MMSDNKAFLTGSKKADKKGFCQCQKEEFLLTSKMGSLERKM
jgi:hypothetical protein